LPLLSDSSSKDLQDRPILGNEVRPEGSRPRDDLRVERLSLGFIRTAGLKIDTRAGAIDFHFTLGAATYRTDGRLFGWAESLGGSLGAERTKRHKAWSIHRKKGSLTYPERPRIIERFLRGWGVY